jgi:predicted phosphodiesterase
MASLKYAVESTDTNAVAVRMIVPSAYADWEQSFLLMGDVHWDNPHCQRDLLTKHLNQAKERGAGIIDCGDFFCAMQGKYDKRSSKSDIRPEHQYGNYLDRLVDTAADFLEPYKQNLLVLGRGNHESSIKNRHETDLTDRLCTVLRTRGSGVQPGGYCGWVRFMFDQNRARASRRLWYAHGWGGGGPVTINTIQAANRMPMMVDGADVILTGHVHEAWVAEKVRTKLNDAGRVEQRTLYIVQTPTYKEEYGDGRGGWHVETGKPPKPLGAWWLKWRWSVVRSGPTKIAEPVCEFTRAS